MWVGGALRGPGRCCAPPPALMGAGCWGGGGGGGRSPGCRASAGLRGAQAHTAIPPPTPPPAPAAPPPPPQDANVCWICLDCSGALIYPCKCPRWGASLEGGQGGKAIAPARPPPRPCAHPRAPPPPLPTTPRRTAHPRCLARWQLQSAGTRWVPPPAIGGGGAGAAVAACRLPLPPRWLPPTPPTPPPPSHHPSPPPPLNRAGRKETHCEFCDSLLPDWKRALTPVTGANAPAVMNVNFDGRTYSFEVKPGPGEEGGLCVGGGGALCVGVRSCPPALPPTSYTRPPSPPSYSHTHADGYRQFSEAIRRAFSLPEDSELNITFTCDEPSAGECGRWRARGAAPPPTPCLFTDTHTPLGASCMPPRHPSPPLPPPRAPQSPPAAC